MQHHENKRNDNHTDTAAEPPDRPDERHQEDDWDGAPCEDVLTQMNAVNGALHKLSFLMLDAHVRHCVREGMKAGHADETIESLAEAIERFSKMA